MFRLDSSLIFEEGGSAYNKAHIVVVVVVVVGSACLFLSHE